MNNHQIENIAELQSKNISDVIQPNQTNLSNQPNQIIQPNQPIYSHYTDNIKVDCNPDDGSDIEDSKDDDGKLNK